METTLNNDDIFFKAERLLEEEWNSEKSLNLELDLIEKQKVIKFKLKDLAEYIDAYQKIKNEKAAEDFKYKNQGI
jgi:hypothetical protein